MRIDDAKGIAHLLFIAQIDLYRFVGYALFSQHDARTAWAGGGAAVVQGHHGVHLFVCALKIKIFALWFESHWHRVARAIGSLVYP